jgi:DNA-binding NarL/FixJ family response regulator
MIKVLICDDQPLVRESLMTTLGIEDGLEVVGQADNGADAVQKVEALQPDVVLMDIHMPIMDGIEATRRITGANANTRVVILTTRNSEKHVLDCLRSGASGYALKEGDSDDLATVIEKVYRGERYIEPSLASEAIFELARSRPQVSTHSHARSHDGVHPHSDHSSSGIGHA